MPLQVTGLFAALLTLLYIGLCLRVVYLRRTRRVGLGDGGHVDLTRAVRAHANFAENVPLALILLGLLEMARQPAMVLYGYGVLLLAARLLHVWGLAQSEGVSPGRFWGTLLSWLAMLLASGLLIYLFAAQRILMA